jgi:hypothetical protein
MTGDTYGLGPLDIGAVGAHASQVCLLYCHLPHVRLILCYFIWQVFQEYKRQVCALGTWHFYYTLKRVYRGEGRKS